MHASTMSSIRKNRPALPNAGSIVFPPGRLFIVFANFSYEEHEEKDRGRVAKVIGRQQGGHFQ